jgi:hypothetical protein
VFPYATPGASVDVTSLEHAIRFPSDEPVTSEPVRNYDLSYLSTDLSVQSVGVSRRWSVLSQIRRGSTIRSSCMAMACMRRPSAPARLPPYRPMSRRRPLYLVSPRRLPPHRQPRRPRLTGLMLLCHNMR